MKPNQTNNNHHHERQDFNWLDDQELIYHFRFNYRINQHQDQKGIGSAQRLYNRLYIELNHRGYKPEEWTPGPDWQPDHNVT